MVNPVSPQYTGRGKGKSTITCWTCGKPVRTSKSLSVATPPVFQLDATDSEHPPMPRSCQSSQVINSHRVVIECQVFGIQLQSWTSTTESRMTLAPRSSVRMIGQKWPLPIKGDQTLQSVTDADIKTHGFKRCTIMSGDIVPTVNFIVFDVSFPIIGNSTMEESQCYAMVKPRPHKSWIVNLHTAHGTRMVKIGKHSAVTQFILENGVIDRLFKYYQIDGEPPIKQFAENLITSFNGEVKSRLSPSLKVGTALDSLI
eukprot:2615247-Amphidinium_carterae.1